MLISRETGVAAAAGAVAGSRSYLFLQGPAGPFFRCLGSSLREAGHRVCRVNFHGGDVFDWPFPEMCLYRGTQAGFPQFLVDLVDRRQVTDLVVFADCRPLHAAGIQSLKVSRPGVRVHVLEEGYLRPDWITLERGGVNARSPLMKVGARWSAQAEAGQPCPPAQQVGDAVLAQALHAIGYYCASWASRWLFPHYKHHRQSWAQGEARSWVPRTLGRHWRVRRARARERALYASGSPFFMLLLQVNCDKQILVHSPIKSMRLLMETVVPSFAANAPAGCKLVVKVHPLDSGLWPHEADLAEIAAEHGVADRVVFLDGCDLNVLLERSAGAITINSTAGVAALHKGVPLFSFGEAIYNTAGLTHQGSLDSFWAAPQAPGEAHYWAFRRVVVHRSQINGGFYTRRGIDMALPAVMRALGGIPVGDSQAHEEPMYVLLPPSESEPKIAAAGSALGNS